MKAIGNKWSVWFRCAYYFRPDRPRFPRKFALSDTSASAKYTENRMHDLVLVFPVRIAEYGDHLESKEVSADLGRNMQ